MANKRFQRPIDSYSGAEDLLYKDKYQKDSKAVPKIAISSIKMDGDLNYLVDAVNTLDEDVKSIVYSGIANETILEEHISENAVTETKIANDAITARSLTIGSVTNTKLADLSVTTQKIANNSITKDKISLNSVGTEEVIDKSITRDKLADDAISDSVPVGTIAQFSADLLPTGWILCNGAELSKNTYPQLVKFLTNSDATLTADLPNLNTDTEALAKFAIKAFSDTIELANLDIAGLTQDVANNSALVVTKAPLIADPIAFAECEASGSLSRSSGVSHVIRESAGQYRIYLKDEIKGKGFVPMLTNNSWTMSYITEKDIVNATFTVKTPNTSGIHADNPFTFIVYERIGDGE